MALTTIHTDDRRNITPKMTQALQRSRTLGVNGEDLHLASLHNDVTTTQPKALGPTIIFHPPTMPTHSIRINTESFLEHSSVIYHQTQPHRKGSHRST